MSDRLTPRQLDYLRSLQQQLTLQATINREVKARDLAILKWCEEECLISFVPPKGDRFDYTQELLASVAERLVQLGYAPLDETLARTSLEQAQQGRHEFKSNRAGPRANRVLLAQRTGSDDTWQILDVAQSELDLAAYEQLVLVENLDCFYQLVSFALPLAPNALVIYRGDHVYAQGAQTLRKRWLETGKTMDYFGDLDAAGIAIAFQLGCHRIAGPSFKRFCEKAHSSALSAEQFQTLQQLTRNQELAPQLREYLEYMESSQSGLLQQWLQQEALEWLTIQALGN